MFFKVELMSVCVSLCI